MKRGRRVVPGRKARRPPIIHLADLQRRVRVPRATVRRLARQIAGKKSLSIAFVTNAAIRRLNRKFLRHDFATDVLSFRIDGDIFGEVVVSADYARAEARRRGISAQEELLRYVAHGILHLLGYDDHRPRDRARMWARQERELRKAGVSRERSRVRRICLPGTRRVLDSKLVQVGTQRCPTAETPRR